PGAARARRLACRELAGAVRRHFGQIQRRCSGGAAYAATCASSQVPWMGSGALKRTKAADRPWAVSVARRSSLRDFHHGAGIRDSPLSSIALCGLIGERGRWRRRVSLTPRPRRSLVVHRAGADPALDLVCLVGGQRGPVERHLRTARGRRDLLIEDA